MKLKIFLPILMLILVIILGGCSAPTTILPATATLTALSPTETMLPTVTPMPPTETPTPLPPTPTPNTHKPHPALPGRAGVHSYFDPHG